MIRAARNGCAKKITFQGKNVYHNWNEGIPFSSLGEKLDKTTFLKNVVVNENMEAVEIMLLDWNLYENGWHVEGSGRENTQLFRYLCQFNYNRPAALQFLN